MKTSEIVAADTVHLIIRGTSGLSLVLLQVHLHSKSPKVNNFSKVLQEH